MFFASLIIFLTASMFLPWYGLALLGFAMGLIWRMNFFTRVYVAAAAGLSQVLLAFYNDGRLNGLVSARLSVLFHLPIPELMYLAVGLMTSITVWLWLCGATWLRDQAVQLKLKSLS